MMCWCVCSLKKKKDSQNSDKKKKGVNIVNKLIMSQCLSVEYFIYLLIVALKYCPNL